MTPKTRTQVYEELKDLRRRGELQQVGDVEAALEESPATVQLAERVFGDEKKARAWLRRPNASMSGQVPLDLMKDELGAAVVRDVLEQIDHGIFA